MAQMSEQTNDNGDFNQAAADLIVARAAEMVIEIARGTVENVIDRMATYAVAQIVHTHGPDTAATALRLLADKVDAGAFASVEADQDRSAN